MGNKFNLICKKSNSFFLKNKEYNCEVVSLDCIIVHSDNNNVGYFHTEKSLVLQNIAFIGDYFYTKKEARREKLMKIENVEN